MTNDKLRKNIISAFGYHLQGNQRMKYFVADSVMRLPQTMGEAVIDHCWFVSSFEDSWAFALREEDLKKGDCLIFLSDELLKENAEQIRWTILHEIGHFVLGHKNAILVPQTKREIAAQEKQADAFALQYSKL